MAKTLYPHVTNSTASVQKYEPVVASNFNSHIVLMGTLAEKLGDYAFLSEYIKSVEGLFVEKSGNVIEAGYKTTKFRYDSNEKETFYEITLQFFNFLDEDSRMFVYNALVKWSREKYNPLTGEKNLKKHYANANIVVEKFNRDGTVFWRRIGHHIFPMNDFDDQTTNYETHDMTDLSVVFNCDYVSDVTNDPRLAGDTL